MSARKQLLFLITLVCTQVCLHDAAHHYLQMLFETDIPLQPSLWYKAKPYKKLFDQN